MLSQNLPLLASSPNTVTRNGGVRFPYWLSTKKHAQVVVHHARTRLLGNTIYFIAHRFRGVIFRTLTLFSTPMIPFFYL